MIGFENKIEMSLQQLLEDERLRSNLIDAEANLLFDWATTRLTNSVSLIADETVGIDALRAETRRVRQALRGLNDLFDGDQLPAPPAALTALDLPPIDPMLPLPDRATLIRWLLKQISTAWANASDEA